MIFLVNRSGRDDTEMFTESEGDCLEEREESEADDDTVRFSDTQSESEQSSVHYATPGTPRPVSRGPDLPVYSMLGTTTNSSTA